MRSLIKSIELNPTLADNHLRLIELSIKNGMDLRDVEQLYEGALSVCGLHPAEGPVVWSEYRRFLSQKNEESVQLRVSKVRDLFYRQMSLPLSGLPDLLDEYRIWEEELSDESRESFEVAKEHYSRGQQEWSLRKPLEMRVQTDNVSNLQELFDAWMVYINFEKDRMLSIDYSSDAVPLKESSSGCSRSGSPAKYRFGTKDSVIMAYRRALDDLGSIRIDLWLEFANFISTTTNCPHLLSEVYASSLQHFSTNPKLWILYLLATAEAVKDIVSHFCQFRHFYRPGCRVRSSATWYPQNDQILKVTNLKEMLEIILDNYLSELAHSQEIFSESKQDALELYFVVTNSLLDINKSLKAHSDAAKRCTPPEADTHSGGGGGGADCRVLEELIFGKLERLYLKGEELLLGGSVRLTDGRGGAAGGGFQVLEESVVLFYSQWLDFELSRSKSMKEVAVSMLEKVLDKREEQQQAGTTFLSLVISVVKARLSAQEQTELWQSLKLVLDLYPGEVRDGVSAEWESAGDSARYTDGGKRQRLDLTEGDPSVLYSPTIRHIPLGVSSSSEGGKLSQEISQCVLPMPILQQGQISGAAGSRHSGLSSKSKANDEGDFVCLSEIRLRRDKRRNRRNFNESDYDTSSECSSESNSFSALVGGGSSSSGANGGRQLFRNFTPPGTPTSYALQKMPAALAQSHNQKSSPCSPSVAAATATLAVLHSDLSSSNSFTPKGNNVIKSPVLIPQDLEARTQCTWDGREAIEPSIAPPIPPIPPLSSISSVSSTSSHSSLSSSRQFERPGSSQLILSGEREQQQYVFGLERAAEDQNMPPPPYTPKKSRQERSGGGNAARQPSASSAAAVVSASEDSDLSSGLGDSSRAGGDSSSDSEKKTETLFVRFPQDQEMDEEKLKRTLLDHFPVNISQVRVVRDAKGNQRGFAYVDVDPGAVDEITRDAEGRQKLEGLGVQVSASDPPQRSWVPRRSHQKGRRRQARRRQLQAQQDAAAGSTILVKNIDKSMSEEQVASHFQDGLGLKVKNISISRDQSGASRGFAFMEFFSPEEALSAHMLNESKLGSSNITVSSSTRPLTFPRLTSSSPRTAGLADSLNARFAPRAKSKQKLPQGRPVSSSSGEGVLEESRSLSVGGGGASSSLTNEDFRRMFL